MIENKCIGREVLRIEPTDAHPRHSEGSFLRLKDGRILFIYSRFNGGNGDNDPCSLVRMYSSDEGETWTEPVVTVSAAQFGVLNVMSVSLIEMQNGDIGMFYGVKYGLGEDRFMLARSNDGGETWYSHTECTLADRRGYYVLNNERVIRLTSGRLIIPLAFHRGSANRTDPKGYLDLRAVCFFLLSDDDGYTWRESKDGVYPPFTHTVTGLQEPGVVELDNGVVWAYFRTDHMYHYEAFSFDGGDTWTIPQPSRFTGPASPLSIKNIDGALYAMWNPIPNYNGRCDNPYSGRTVMAIARNENGVWTEPKVMEENSESDFCYPAAIRVADGLLIAYADCRHGRVSLNFHKVSTDLT